MKSPLTNLILVCLVLTATAAGYWFWYAAIEAKSAVAADLESQITAKTEAASRIASARASLAEIAGDEASVQNYFVPETGVVTFINDLQTRGQTLGTAVTVLSVSTGGTSAQPTLAFSLTIKGTFDAVMRTVGAIEYSPYNLSVSTFSLGQDGKDSWHADLDLSVGSLSANAAVTPSGSDALGTSTP